MPSGETYPPRFLQSTLAVLLSLTLSHTLSLLAEIAFSYTARDNRRFGDAGKLQFL